MKDNIKFMIMKKHLCVLFIMAASLANAQTPNSWNRVADFPDSARTAAIAFSIDSFGYVGLGAFYSSGYAYPISLWQYNPYTNVWTQKANFPGAGRGSAICFVIGSKAYVGLGAGDGLNFYNDLWEYDPSTDTWTQKADFGGGGRAAAIGFSIGNLGYAGLGTSLTNAGPYRDIWQYDPTADIWTQKNDFTGLPRGGASGFSIGSSGYVALGYDEAYNGNGLFLNDLWQYDTASDSWTQKANYPGKASGGAFTFNINGMVYLGTGEDSTYKCYRDFWKYDPQTDTWTQKDSFGNGIRAGAIAFSIGNTGYAGTGDTSNYVCLNDFWMYTPDSINTGVKPVDQTSISIYPDPATDRIYINNLPPLSTLKVCDLTGRSVNTVTTGNEIDVSALPAGIYLLHIQSSGGDSFVKKFTKL